MEPALVENIVCTKEKTFKHLDLFRPVDAVVTTSVAKSSEQIEPDSFPISRNVDG